MSDAIQLLRNHRSIRKFRPDPVRPDHLEQMLLAAQSASTSSNIQAYSVVGVRDPERKAKLTEWAGHQQHIAECPLFLVWCADLHKVQVAVSFHETFELKQNTELFLLGSIDAALAAQNAAIAAESLGYGFVFVGGLRNKPRQVSDLLRLPRFVYPVFGMSLGVPDHHPEVRPRLPLAALYHEETYDGTDLAQSIREYDDMTRHYYANRTVFKPGEASDTFWSREMARRFRSERLRDHLHDFLTEQGFSLT